MSVYEAFQYLFIFWLGAVVGSFLNVVGLRLLREESIVWPNSHCYTCNERIAYWDNIPIFSWFILRGRCRKCKHPFSWQYPAVEFLTGVLFLSTVVVYGFTLQAAMLMILIGNFIVILITDFREHYIYDINSLGIIPLGLIFSFLNLNGNSGVVPLHLGSWQFALPQIFLSALLSMAVVYVFFFVLNLVSRLIIGADGFGEGDTRLLMGIGAFFGLKAVIIIFITSFFIQTLFGIPMLFIQWWRSGAKRSVLFMLVGFSAALLPYLMQQWITEFLILAGVAVLSIAVAVATTWKALQYAKSKEIAYTALPFGPAIVFATLVILYFQNPLLHFVQQRF